MFERARQPAFFGHCQTVLARHRVTIDAVREPADHPVLLAEVAVGRALALLPRSFTALRRSGVSYRPLVEGDELAVGIGLVLHAADARCAICSGAARQTPVDGCRRRSESAYRDSPLPGWSGGASILDACRRLAHNNEFDWRAR